MQVEHAIFGLGTPEVVLIVVLALVLFGGKKIPELMRGLGEGVREFNAAKANIKQEIEAGMKEKPATSAATPTTEEKKA
jgi:sec-independent protein translocase protein TatA